MQLSHQILHFFFNAWLFLCQGQSICEWQGAELGAHQPVAALPPEMPQSWSKTNILLCVCCLKETDSKLDYLVVKYFRSTVSTLELCHQGCVSEPWSLILVSWKASVPGMLNSERPVVGVWVFSLPTNNLPVCFYFRRQKSTSWPQCRTCCDSVCSPRPSCGRSANSSPSSTTSCPGRPSLMSSRYSREPNTNIMFTVGLSID